MDKNDLIDKENITADDADMHLLQAGVVSISEKSQSGNETRYAEMSVYDANTRLCIENAKREVRLTNHLAFRPRLLNEKANLADLVMLGIHRPEIDNKMSLSRLRSVERAISEGVEIKGKKGTETFRVGKNRQFTTDTFEVEVEVQIRPLRKPPFMMLGENMRSMSLENKTKLLKRICTEVSVPGAVVIAVTSGLNTTQILNIFDSLPTKNPLKILKNPVDEIHKLDLIINELEDSADSIKQVRQGKTTTDAVEAWVDKNFGHTKNLNANPNWRAIFSPMPFGLHREIVTVEFYSAQKVLLEYAFKNRLFIENEALDRFSDRMTTMVRGTRTRLEPIPRKFWAEAGTAPGLELNNFQDLEMILSIASDM